PVTIAGTNCIAGVTVSFGGHSLVPVTLSATTITVSVPAADIAVAGPVSVMVVTSDGVSSNAVTFTVNPAPAITSIAPTNLTAGQPPLTVANTGTNYVGGDTAPLGAH